MHLCLILPDSLLNSLLHTLHSSVIVGNYLALCYKLPAIPFCAMLHHTIYSHLYLLLFTTSLHHHFRDTSRIWLWKPTKRFLGYSTVGHLGHMTQLVTIISSSLHLSIFFLMRCALPIAFYSDAQLRANTSMVEGIEMFKYLCNGV